MDCMASLFMALTLTSNASRRETVKLSGSSVSIATSSLAVSSASLSFRTFIILLATPVL